MSSFEPLFSKAGRTRITPRTVVTVSATREWMPRPTSSVTPVAVPAFATDFEDAAISPAAQAELAAAEALAQARREELDAAHLRGLTEGRSQGEAAERARLRGALSAAERALDDVRTAEARWLVNIEENLAAIGVAVAHQIIVREVTIAPDIVLEMVTRAVQEFGLDQALSIRVNPGDLESLHSVERDGQSALEPMTNGREVRWIADARVEPGGCVVEGRERIVDGRVDTALERLYRRLTYTHA
jgi:flagellar assembly protein FliH